jgi:DNA-binding PadR family transcriptional regulator
LIPLSHGEIYVLTEFIQVDESLVERWWVYLLRLTYYAKRTTVSCMSKRTPSNDAGLGRNNEPSLLILMSLVSGTKHGYALTKDIEDFAGVTLGPGTLYGAITRLEERGLIEPTPSEDRRQPYRITSNGRTALAAAVNDMRALSEVGASRLGLRASSRGLRGQVRPARAAS